MRACSYQPYPFAIRVVLRERASRGNGSSERTPKENTSRLLLTGRCLATDPRKERITPLLGRRHSNLPKKNRLQRKHNLCLAKGDAYEY
jgi:hypothetical protein